ncbi:methylamine utilization protein [Thalassotalea castellviae]|uniref:Methylamine utilization protein n=1 Tax=Thalassotalea castellviae TaxID=3075612 RepID=A0ABU3A215_9GAMM|nr:methylamine utilization protein [Thalassotalea sp. W431]MDT0604226.1 methylamine utilization protein [Thalassotalea sp. W431]
MIKFSFIITMFFVVLKSHAVTFTIYDEKQQPLPNTVVWLTSKDNIQPVKPIETPFIMMQKERQFIPHILVVPQHAKVEFPNADSIMHHVYSFSKSKTFELKLYHGQPQSPVVFEQTGVVELGCNIHDWMLSFIVVVDSPFYAITDAQGQVSLNVEHGEYTLNLWHEGFTDFSQVEKETIQLSADQFSYQLKQAVKAIIPIEIDEFDDYE